MRNRNEFKVRRKALEILARQGALHCGKHDCQITRGLMYKKKCYTGRNRENNICPYLQIQSQSNDYGCRKK
ncbi:hypothetical protein LCGC14_1883970 [marine sediment metagenome]|uniref:Uncharacterized protein n=1 Tax=marine sediment metagenome TaxID=412755 RepID=A0A0F9GPS6_9ZZZZ